MLFFFFFKPRFGYGNVCLCFTRTSSSDLPLGLCLHRCISKKSFKPRPFLLVWCSLWQLPFSPEVDLQPEAIRPQLCSSWRPRRLQQSQSGGRNSQCFHGFSRPDYYHQTCSQLPDEQERWPGGNRSTWKTGIDSVTQMSDTLHTYIVQDCCKVAHFKLCLLLRIPSFLSVTRRRSGAKWRISMREKKMPTTWPTMVCPLWMTEKNISKSNVEAMLHRWTFHLQVT